MACQYGTRFSHPGDAGGWTRSRGNRGTVLPRRQVLSGLQHIVQVVLELNAPPLHLVTRHYVTRVIAQSRHASPASLAWSRHRIARAIASLAPFRHPRQYVIRAIELSATSHRRTIVPTRHRVVAPLHHRVTAPSRHSDIASPLLLLLFMLLLLLLLLLFFCCCCLFVIVFVATAGVAVVGVAFIVLA